MMFGKKKKEEELRAKQELEQKRLEEERLREEQLRREMEAEKQRAAEEAAKIVPYKFSVPDPKPKELISVLTNMLKKLFPETRKAYLVLTELDDKKGYLLVIDIDAKFFKILHMYLDGETKKVRHGLPIECILYSKSGNLTDKMQPFYEKTISEMENIINKSSSDSGEVKFSAMPEFGLGTIDSDLNDGENELPAKEDAVLVEEAAEPEPEQAAEAVEEAAEPEPEQAAEAVEEAAEPEPEQAAEAVGEVAEPEPEQMAEEASVKVVPETKQQLFLMMNRIGADSSEESLTIAREGFGEFEFYIPYTSESTSSGMCDSFEADARPVLLINRDHKIKAIVFFTDKEEAEAFASKNECGIAHVKYKDYKQAFSDGTLVQVAAEGIIINPNTEQILLAPDYCLL